MSELIASARGSLERSERLRFALLAAFTVVLAAAFLALLVAQQVEAAAL